MPSATTLTSSLSSFNLSLSSTFSFTSKNTKYSAAGDIKTSNNVILSCNIRSLQKHFQSIKDIILETSPCIFLMQEIWQIQNPTPFHINNYTLHINQRNKSLGGGVGFYIRNDIDIVNYDSILLEKIFESQLLTIKINNNHFTILNNYIGHKDKKISLEKFKTFLNKAKLTKYPIIACGDYNINLLQDNQLTKDFQDILLDYAILPNINIPTRVEIKNGTVHSSLIDNIITKMDFPGDFKVLTDPIADHFILMLEIHNNKKHTKKPTYYYKREITEENINRLKENLEINWNYLENMSTDQAVESFTNILSNKINTYLPLVKHEWKGKKENPWFTSGLQKSKLKLRKLIKTYNKDPCSLNKIRLDNYNKAYKSLIRTAKNNYYTKKLHESWGDSKAQWNLVNSITGRLTKDTHGVAKLLINNKYTTNSKSIANAFANYFSTIGKNLVKDKVTDMRYHNYLDNYKPKSEFKFKPVNIATVKKIIRSLKNKNSCGEDGISNRILKLLCNEICRPLTYILNSSLKNSHYPKQWKISKVITLFKSGSKTEVGNYRPISLQNVLSKILERTVKLQLMNYLESNSLLPENQFGFRSKQGINHLHLFLQNKITNALSKKQIFKLCFLDYSKAFDVVNFKLLLKKLKCLGINNRELDWFKSYLYDRHMYCTVNGKISLKRPTETGVPQGTVLGPILFLCYTFDFNETISNFCSFADDTSIFCQGDTDEEVSNELSKTLEKVTEWVNNNKLKLNVNKTKIMTFGTDITTNNLTVIKMDDTTLENVETYKLLGLTIDSNLTWKHHIDFIHKKLKYVYYTINKVKNCMPLKSKLLLYNALFESNMAFGIPIWGGVSKNKLKPIEITQKKTLRCIYNLPYNAHTKEYFELGTIKPLINVYKYHSILLCRSIRYNPPINIKNLLTDATIPIGPHTRQRQLYDQLDVPKLWNVKLAQQCPMKIAIIWNELPCDLKMNVNESFKKEIKNHLLSKI